MSAKQTKEIKKQKSKEQRKEIALQLSQAVPLLKEKLGEKKFDKRIKKAAKLLSDGIESSNGIKSSNGKKAAASKSTSDKPKQSGQKASSPVGKKAGTASK